MRVTTIFLISFFLSTLYSLAQENPNEFIEEKPILYKRELSFGATIHSSGWGLDFRNGKNLTVNKKRMYEIEIVGMKHPKEYKSYNYQFENSKSFVYGKLNSFIVSRFGLGEHRVVWTKAERNNIEIRVNGTAGLSLGLAKPVYLIFFKDHTGNEDLFVTERYDPGNEDHALENTYGRAEFLRGIEEIKLHPGIYAKLATTFEYGALDDDIKALEVGMTLDAYPKKIPIMAFIENKQFFFNFYVSLMFGKKW